MPTITITDECPPRGPTAVGSISFGQLHAPDQRTEAMPVYDRWPRITSHVNPRDPYPLAWSPRIYGVSFSLAGPGGTS